MLDMGFKPDLERIMAALPPPSKRQALLFSATMPAGIRELASRFLKPDHEYVSTVDPNEAATHEIITQEAYAVLPSTLFPSLFTTIYHHLATVDPDNYKIIIFLPTARMAQFMASLFRECLPEVGVRPADILDVHSRKSQSARMKACDAFKNGNKCLLFSSDVSARGMDFPDISLVIQVLKQLPVCVEPCQHAVFTGRTNGSRVVYPSTWPNGTRWQGRLWMSHCSSLHC
jgi:ATP-dependent RNA helicase MSS116